MTRGTKRLVWAPIKRNDVSWNFEKFLIDGYGVPQRRFSPYCEIKTLADDIQNMIDGMKFYSPVASCSNCNKQDDLQQFTDPIQEPMERSDDTSTDETSSDGEQTPPAIKRRKLNEN
jgi:hypothetical protein